MTANAITVCLAQVNCCIIPVCDKQTVIFMRNKLR